MTNTNTDIGQFWPTSQRDFDAYAKNLSWLISEPVPSARDLLSRLYGFKNEQDLVTALSKKAKAGPVAADETESASVDGIIQRMQAMGARRSRTLELLAQQKGVPLSSLGKRHWKIVDLNLFESPEEHRSAYSKLRAMYDVLEDRSRGSLRSVGDYAYVETVAVRSFDGASDEARVTFTPLGLAVYSALQEVLPDEFGSGRVDIPDVMRQVEAMIDRHPENPWLRAGYVCTFGRYYFQYGWADNLSVRRRSDQDDRGGYEQLDAHPGFKKYARENSALFLSHAKRAVDLFTELYGQDRDKAAPHTLRGADEDNFYYPAVLYFGALVAQNAGDEKIALQWAKRNRKLVESDNFGARYLLTTLMLNKGASESQIRRLFSKDSTDSMAWLARSAAAAAEGSIETSIDAFIECVSRTWAVLDVLSRRWTKARNRLMVNSNYDSPAFFQEFLERSSGFWTSHPEIRAQFAAVCGDQEVRELVMTHHEIDQLGWGLAFKSHEEQARVRALQSAHPDTFREKMKSRLDQLWEGFKVQCEEEADSGHGESPRG